MSGNVPAPIDLDAEIDKSLSRFKGTARESVVEKLRRMIDQDAKQCAKAMRGLLHQGRPADDA
jgi:hypothetical protein